MTDERPEFLSIPDAAAVLGVSPQCVHQWLAESGATVRTVDLARPTAKKRNVVVETAAIIAWREQRLATGHAVGPIPPHWAPPPAVPDVPPMPIGLMVWRPF